MRPRTRAGGLGSSPTSKPRPSQTITTGGTWTGASCFLFAALLVMIALRAGNAWLLLVGCALAAPVLISQLMRPGMQSLAVCFHGEHRVAVGDQVVQAFHVTNRGRRSTPALRLSHSHPGFAPVGFTVPRLAPGAKVELTARRTALSRGVSNRHEVRLWTTAPFGMAVHRAKATVSTQISVHPARRAAVDLATIGPGDEPGNRPNRAGHQVHELREWQRGDALRQVHWRATARHDRLTVTVPEAGVRSRFSFVLTGSVADPDWESLLSTVAWTAVDVVERGRNPVRLSALGAPDYIGDDPQAVLDWFAGLTQVAGPTAESLRAAADWAGQEGQVILAGTRAPAAAVLTDARGLLLLDPAGLVTRW